MKDTNRRFIIKLVWITKNHTERCSVSSAIGEMQSKATRYHYTPVRVSKLKNNNPRCWQQWRESGSLIPSWWECKMTRLLWKKVCHILKKLNMHLSYNLATFRHLFQKNENSCSYNNLYVIFIAYMKVNL